MSDTRYQTANDLLWDLSRYFLMKVGVGESPALMFRDSHGFLMDPHQALEIIDKLKIAYESPEINAFVEQENQDLHLESMGIDLNHRYLLNGINVYKKKEFDPLKRKRSFSCAWCGTRVSSTKDKEYYYITDHYLRSGLSEQKSQPWEYSCSETCIRHVWDEIYESWMRERGYLTAIK